MKSVPLAFSAPNLQLEYILLAITGEIDLAIDTQDRVPLRNDELVQELTPSAYNMTWPFDARPDPNCDPTQEPIEMWLAGNYTAHVGRFFHVYRVLLLTLPTGQ